MIDFQHLAKIEMNVVKDEIDVNEFDILDFFIYI